MLRAISYHGGALAHDRRAQKFWCRCIRRTRRQEILDGESRRRFSPFHTFHCVESAHRCVYVRLMGSSASSGTRSLGMVGRS